jgi:hypothetical protein
MSRLLVRVQEQAAAAKPARWLAEQVGVASCLPACLQGPNAPCIHGGVVCGLWCSSFRLAPLPLPATATHALILQ